MFKAFIQKQESGSLPQKSFYPVSASSTEKKQDILFKRIHPEVAFDDLCQTSDALAEICITTDHYKSGDPMSFI